VQRVNHVRQRDQAFAGMADGGFGGGVGHVLRSYLRRQFELLEPQSKTIAVGLILES
jgi:hypothetical protein